MDRQTLLELIPAYALGALDEAEQAEVEARLADDPEAQALLADYRAVTQTLSLTTPARTAPAHLADDLRKRVQATQSPAVLAPPPSPATRRFPGWRWLALAASVLVVVVAAWTIFFMQQSEQAVCPNTQALYQQIIAADNYVRVDLNPGEDFAGVVSGELVADPQANAAIMHMRNLPDVPAEQVFQLWLAAPDQTVSGGLFRGTGSDTCIILPLEQPLEQYNGFGVSLEAAGGSPNPNGRTGPRVLNVRLGDA